MILKVHGFILRLTPFQDNSQVATIFTEEFGLRSFLIKNTYWTKRSNKNALLLLLNQVEIVFYERQTREIQLVSNVSLVYHYDKFYKNPQRGVYLQLWVEILRSLLLEAGPQPEIFQWLNQFLLKINQLGQFVFEQTVIGLSELAQLMGYLPEIDETWSKQPIRLNNTLGTFEKTTPDKVEIAPTLIVNLILQKDNHQIFNKIPKNNRIKVLQCWFKIFQIHIPHFKEPVSLSIWETIWKDLSG